MPERGKRLFPATNLRAQTKTGPNVTFSYHKNTRKNLVDKAITSHFLTVDERSRIIPYLSFLLTSYLVNGYGW